MGRRPSCFLESRQAPPGDKIYVLGPDGSGATYESHALWLIDADDPADPLIADTGFEALTLITCDGSGMARNTPRGDVVRATHGFDRLKLAGLDCREAHGKAIVAIVPLPSDTRNLESSPVSLDNRQSNWQSET